VFTTISKIGVVSGFYTITLLCIAVGIQRTNGEDMSVGAISLFLIAVGAFTVMQWLVDRWYLANDAIMAGLLLSLAACVTIMILITY
jgi:hypothetical protein